jgi:hypothetical protein
MINFAATLLALKFAESTRGLEFDGWDDVLGTAVICWLGSWLAELVLSALVISDAPSSLMQGLLLSFGSQVFITMVAILLAAAVVNGAHLRNAFGVIVASILVVGFTYGAAMLMAASGFGLWF